MCIRDRPEGSGFFLQVEGASIDKQNHRANACGQIGETVDLDEAVQVALAFAVKDQNTSIFLTADDAPMTISYATSEDEDSMKHTGSQVRIAGYGPGAANVVGLTDQTDLNATIRRILGL